MKVLGIVGGIGAGKTTVVRMIMDLKSTYVIGADEIGHKLLLKGGKAYDKVIQTFGESILDEKGSIVRSKLAQIVFSDPKELAKLNGISHPLIFEEVKSQIERCKQQNEWELVIIDAALLIEIGLVKLVDYVVGIYAEEEIRIKRVMEREGFSEEEARKRIASQKNWKEFESISHYVINNSLSYQNTKEEIEKMISNW